MNVTDDSPSLSVFMEEDQQQSIAIQIKCNNALDNRHKKRMTRIFEKPECIEMILEHSPALSVRSISRVCKASYVHCIEGKDSYVNRRFSGKCVKIGYDPGMQMCSIRISENTKKYSHKTTEGEYRNPDSENSTTEKTDHNRPEYYCSDSMHLLGSFSTGVVFDGKYVGNITLAAAETTTTATKTIAQNAVDPPEADADCDSKIRKKNGLRIGSNLWDYASKIACMVPRKHGNDRRIARDNKGAIKEILTGATKEILANDGHNYFPDPSLSKYGIDTRPEHMENNRTIQFVNSCNYQNFYNLVWQTARMICKHAHDTALCITKKMAHEKNEKFYTEPGIQHLFSGGPTERMDCNIVLLRNIKFSKNLRHASTTTTTTTTTKQQGTYVRNNAFLLRFHNLKMLKWISCLNVRFDVDSFGGHDVLSAWKPPLEVLHIDCNSTDPRGDVSPKSILFLVSLFQHTLEVLRITGCKSLNGDTLWDVVKKCKKLTSLYVEKCAGVQSSKFAEFGRMRSDNELLEAFHAVKTMENEAMREFIIEMVSDVNTHKEWKFCESRTVSMFRAPCLQKTPMPSGARFMDHYIGITALSLCGCTSVFDNVHPHLFDFPPYLISLDLGNIGNIPGEVLFKVGRLVHLEMLALSGCSTVGIDHVGSWATIPRLTHLSMSACPNCDDDVVMMITIHFPYLVELVLSGNPGITQKSIEHLTHGCENSRAIRINTKAVSSRRWNIPNMELTTRYENIKKQVDACRVMMGLSQQPPELVKAYDDLIKMFDELRKRLACQDPMRFLRRVDLSGCPGISAKLSARKDLLNLPQTHTESVVL